MVVAVNLIKCALADVDSMSALEDHGGLGQSMYFKAQRDKARANGAAAR